MAQQNEEKLPAKTAEKKAAPWQRMLAFSRNVKQEMKLVTTPSWEEVRSTTLVVIVFVFLFAFYLKVVDWILSPLDRWIFSR